MIPRKKVFEQVRVDEWINGEIVEIQYETDHEFTYKGIKSNGDAVKILIQLDGYKDKKSTGWWSFNYAKKSKLFTIFIEPLVVGAEPNMSFDLDNLKNLRVKVMYTQNGEYQNLAMVRPIETKILPKSPPAVKQEAEEEVPF